MYYRFYPQQIDDKPPTLYKLLDSICNASHDDVYDFWDNDEKVKIYDLAENARETVFRGINYPLHESVVKETFETDILNHFLLRRIGYQTYTAFKVALNNKLREIMPKYNLLFGLFEKKLDLLSDDTVERYTQKTDNSSVNNGGFDTEQTGSYQTDVTGSYQTNVDGTNNTDVTGSTRSDEGGTFTEGESYKNVDDKRYSDTPQNRLGDVQAGEYVSEYHYDTTTGNKDKDGSHTEIKTGTHTEDTDNVHSDTTRNTHTDTTGNTHTDNTANTHTDTDIFDGLINFNKTITTTNNKIDKLLKLQNELENIMTMIYADLDVLFYQIYD